MGGILLPSASTPMSTSLLLIHDPETLASQVMVRVRTGCARSVSSVPLLSTRPRFSNRLPADPIDNGSGLLTRALVECLVNQLKSAPRRLLIHDVSKPSSTSDE